MRPAELKEHLLEVRSHGDPALRLALPHAHVEQIEVAAPLVPRGLGVRGEGEVELGDDVTKSRWSSTN